MAIGWFRYGGRNGGGHNDDDSGSRVLEQTWWQTEIKDCETNGRKGAADERANFWYTGTTIDIKTLTIDL